jgi:uncharacterized membrane protein YphA (DoxX/SURF4 family)
LAAVVMLVLLRISIGWHFTYQGISKFSNSNFSSEGFLAQAKGPLVENFWALIPDYDGYERLSMERMGARWDAYLEEFRGRYTLDEQQQAEAVKRLESRKAILEDYLASQRDGIGTYFHDLERVRTTEEGQAAFQEKRAWDQRKKVRSQAAPWLKWVDDQDKQFREDLQNLLTEEQGRGNPPTEPLTQLKIVDVMTKYSNILIGVCLIVGLFTRFAAVSGAVFLGMIVLSQPPWPTIYPPDPPSAGKSMIVNKEFIEMLALATLATMPVGRWGGLDWFVHHLIVRKWFGRGETS